MTAGYAVAPGRADHETHLLVMDIANAVLDEIEGKLLGVVVNGRVPATAVSGQLGASQGGTGNTLGQTTPLDGSVTDVKVASGADINPLKLNQAELLDLVYTLVKGYLVAGNKISITPDDLLHHLTLAFLGVEVLSSDSAVDLTGRNRLRFGDGTVEAEGTDGAVYFPSVIHDTSGIGVRVPVLDGFGNQVLDGFGNPVWVYSTSVVGTVRKAAQTIGDGVATSIVFTHSLGSTDVGVSIYQTASPFYAVYPDIRIVDANNVALDFSVAPTAGQYRVVVMG
jgi:hypothetical protein